MGEIAPLPESGAQGVGEWIQLFSAHWRRPRRSVVALIVIFLGVFAAVPSASAEKGHGHGRHIQHFLLLSTDPSEEDSVIIANGPIHARGTDRVVSETEDTLEFPDGTLSIVHKPKKEGRDTFDPVTCYFTYTERGTYKVTGGTGDYEDARGHGRYSVNASGVGCDPEAEPDVFTLRIKASGPLHY